MISLAHYSPLNTNKVLVERGAEQTSAFVAALANSTERSFLPQRRVHANKDKFHLRRAIKLDVVAEYYLYELVHRSRDRFRRPHAPDRRRHFGYRFKDGLPDPDYCHGLDRNGHWPGSKGTRHGNAARRPRLLIGAVWTREQTSPHIFIIVLPTASVAAVKPAMVIPDQKVAVSKRRRECLLTRRKRSRTVRRSRAIPATAHHLQNELTGVGMSVRPLDFRSLQCS